MWSGFFRVSSPAPIPPAAEPWSKLLAIVMAGEPIVALRADQQATQLILDALVEGQLFFASADFMAHSTLGSLKRVRIDVSRAHIWDLTGVTPWIERS